jgi:hypothetical protein
MSDVQGEFGSCRLIETLSTKVTMPGHPTLLDDPVKAVGVVWAKDVPGSMVWARIRFGLFHRTLLSASRHNVVRVRNRAFQRTPPQEHEILYESKKWWYR